MIEPVSPLIAVPCYGQIRAGFVESLLALQATLLRLGIAHEIKFLPGESLITRARNRLVREFLDEHRERTHLLFLDADLLFHPNTILRLLSSGHDVVAAPYAKKAIGQGLVGNPEATNVRQVNGKPVADVERRGGFVKAKDAGTGCMLISRAAFEKMIAAKREDGEPAMVPYTCDMTAGAPKTYPFFDCGPENGRDSSARYLSEDFYFCRLWQIVGEGHVWLDEHAKIVHIGEHGYSAPSFAEQWKQESVS